MKNTYIRNATEEHLEEIRFRLRSAYDADENGGGTFNNMNLIEDDYRKRKLAVLWRGDEMLGFCAGLLRAGGGNFMIFPQYQGRGFGRKFVDHIIEVSSIDDDPIFSVQFTNESKKFWMKVGFSIEQEEDDGSGIATRAVPKRREIPEYANRCSVKITIFDDQCRVIDSQLLDGFYTDELKLSILLETTYLRRRMGKDFFVRIDVDEVKRFCGYASIAFEIGLKNEKQWSYCTELYLDQSSLESCFPLSSYENFKREYAVMLDKI